MGNSLMQYRMVIGMHSLYLKAREYRECFKGKFWSSLVLLFYMEAIYLPVLKTLVHRFELMKINRLWLTQIYLYRFYIPDLIRLANDVETNPGPNIGYVTLMLKKHFLHLVFLRLIMKGHSHLCVQS